MRRIQREGAKGPAHSSIGHALFSRSRTTGDTHPHPHVLIMKCKAALWQGLIHVMPASLCSRAVPFPAQGGTQAPPGLQIFTRTLQHFYKAFMTAGYQP